VAPRHSLRLRLSGLLLVLALGAFFTRALWLPALGAALVHDDGPEKADIAVVLAGDYYGHRIEKAAELVRAGYVPAALVSGPAYYGTHECDVAIAYIVQRGYPERWFIPFRESALSTGDEAQLILPELERRKVRRFLLVTSDYHSARARRIFRRAAATLGSNIQMRVVAAPDEFFRIDSWWRSREGQKTIFFEWSKTVATSVGL
jgi:uncharacterized SAM-binding protein YcdF (DUF218 family)